MNRQLSTVEKGGGNEKAIPADAALAIKFFNQSDTIQIMGGPGEAQALIHAKLKNELTSQDVDPETGQVMMHLKISEEDLKTLKNDIGQNDISITVPYETSGSSIKGRCGYKKALFVDKSKQLGDGHIIVSTKLRCKFQRDWREDKEDGKAVLGMRRATRAKVSNNIQVQLEDPKEGERFNFELKDFSQYGMGLSTNKKGLEFQPNDTLDLTMDGLKKWPIRVADVRKEGGLTHLGLEHKNILGFPQGVYEKLKKMSQIFLETEIAVREATNAVVEEKTSEIPGLLEQAGNLMRINRKESKAHEPAILTLQSAASEAAIKATRRFMG